MFSWVSENGILLIIVLSSDYLYFPSVIRCLLVDPNPASALNEEAGRLLNENFDEFTKHARLMTSIHAKRPAGPLTASSLANASSLQAAKSIEESPNAKKAKVEPMALKDAPKAVKKSMKRL